MPCRILPLVLRISLLLDREGRAHEGHFKDVLHHGLSAVAPLQVFKVLVSLAGRACMLPSTDILS